MRALASLPLIMLALQPPSLESMSWGKEIARAARDGEEGEKQKARTRKKRANLSRFLGFGAGEIERWLIDKYLIKSNSPVPSYLSAYLRAE